MKDLKGNGIMKMKIWFGLAAAFAAGIASAFNTENVSGAGVTISTTKTLENTTVYNVSGTLTYDLSDQAGASAWVVPEKSTCVINLKPGANLTLIGGNASGMAAAGCGILVPASSTLYITGEGTLNAIGGKAANGGAGGAAGDPILARTSETSPYAYGYAGLGGVGGAGGGGAAPGIGGRGGNGGAGGAEHHRNQSDPPKTEGGPHNNLAAYGDRWQHWSWAPGKAENWRMSGVGGGNGGKGDSGQPMGSVYIVGGVTVNAEVAGENACGTGGGCGGVSSGTLVSNNVLFNEYKDGWNTTVVIGRGGPGGGGGGGGSVLSGIGGGAGGGGGGGAGGEGGARVDCTDFIRGYPGEAGIGGVKEGGNGGRYNDRYVSTDGDLADRNSGLGGIGGQGGAAGQKGGAGRLFASSSPTLVIKPQGRDLDKMQASAVAHDVDIEFLDVEGGQLKGKFMGPLPEAPVPVKPSHRFLGWYLRGRDIRVYDELCEPIENFCQFIDPIVLEAKWEVAPQIGMVNTAEDGENLGPDAEGRERVTLRDAVRAFCENPALTGIGGLRRIAFELPEDKDTIRLTNEIVVAAGTAPFEIYGLDVKKNRAITISPAPDGATPEHRLFDVRSDVTFRFINFVGGKATGSGPDGCGGAVRMMDGPGGSGKISVVSFGDCSFRDNEAACEGGAVWGSGEWQAAYNCTFAGNRSGMNGGAFGAIGPAGFVNCTFSANHAGQSAGGILASNAVYIIYSTFANNTSVTSSKGSSLGYYGQVTKINSLLADGSSSYAEEKLETSAPKVKSLYSSNGTAANMMMFGSAATTNDTLGVIHVLYAPKLSSGSASAAEIYYDGLVENVCYRDPDTTNLVALCGVPTLATTRLGFDQVRDVRLVPARGALRIGIGGQKPAVNVEGRLWDHKTSNWRKSEAKPGDRKNVTVESRYDDGTAVTNTMTSVYLADADNTGYFAISSDVDGSDGYSHNVTSLTVKVQGLEDRPISAAVATVPYALVASSAEAVACEAPTVVAGKETTVNSLLVEQGIVAGEVKVNGDFTADTLQGGGDIRLEGVSLKGGSLEWFADGAGKTFADIGTLDFVDFAKDGWADVGGVRKWTADADGFVQVLFENGQNPTLVSLKVGSVWVTPAEGYVIKAAKRRLLWTCPASSGDVIELKAAGGQCRVQFIPFGK